MREQQIIVIGGLRTYITYFVAYTILYYVVNLFGLHKRLRPTLWLASDEFCHISFQIEFFKLTSLAIAVVVDSLDYSSDHRFPGPLKCGPPLSSLSNNALTVAFSLENC